MGLVVLRMVYLLQVACSFVFMLPDMVGFHFSCNKKQMEVWDSVASKCWLDLEMQILDEVVLMVRLQLPLRGGSECGETIGKS